MAFLIKAKPASVFVLTFGPPFGLALLSTVLIDSPSAEHVLYSISIATLYMGSIFLLWIFSVGKYLSKLMTRVSGIWNRLFKVSVAYLLLILCIVVLLPLLREDHIGQALSTVLLSMLVMALVCIYYVLGYISNAIVSIEKKDQSTFSDYVMVFLALVFFPIGIWSVQSKINRIESFRIKDPGFHQLPYC